MTSGDRSRRTAPHGVLAPGTVLGRFEILNLLSVGGMAEIYLARSEGIAGFEKRVVLKRMLPHFSSQQSYVEMFLAEARLAAMLDHPNIVQVHDIGESTGDYYYAMEYVAGVDLREIVQAERRAGRMVPIPIVAAIGRGLCAGLDFAHSLTTQDGRPLGVVHRDVSLSNVLVSWGGSVKVFDFGVAKVGINKSHTRVGTLKGKLGYMSPEQCRGEQLDRRSDVFAIGIILWEMLCGERLFSGDVEYAVLQRIVDAEVPAPSSIRADVPRLLEAIILRALRKDRPDRYQTARDLQRDLETFARNERLAVLDIELGEYMSELFPPENRGSEIMLGAAIVDGDEADFSVELEIVDGEGEVSPAKKHAKPSAPTTPSQFSLRASHKHWRVGAAAVAVASLVAVTIAGMSGKSASVAPQATGGLSDRTQWQPIPAPTPPAAPAPSATRTAPVAAAQPAPAPAPTPALAQNVAASIGSRAGSSVIEVEHGRDDVRPRRGAPPPAPVRERAERNVRQPVHSASSGNNDSQVAVADAAAAESPALVAAAAPQPPPDAAPAPVASVQKAQPPSASDAPVPPAQRPQPLPKRPQGPGSLDAVPSIARLDVNGALPSSTVRRGIERTLSGYRDCYRSAARSAARTPAATVKVTFEIDEAGLVRNVQAGDASLPGMSRCVRDATSRMRSQATPDVGVAHASVVISFAPTGP